MSRHILPREFLADIMNIIVVHFSEMFAKYPGKMKVNARSLQILQQKRQPSNMNAEFHS